MNVIKYLLFTFSLLVLLQATIFGQTEIKNIYLKDSSMVQGKIINQDDGTLSVETRYGILEIQRDDIIKMEEATTTIRLIDGTTIKGVITSESKDSISIETNYGLMTFSKSNVNHSENKFMPKKESGPTVKANEEVMQDNKLNELIQYDRRWGIKIFGGMSIPIGAFGSTSDRYAGLAEMGFSFGSEFTSEVSKGFELGITGMFASNTMNESEATKMFQSLLQGFNLNWKADVKSWQLIWLLGDVGFTIPISTSSWFYGKGLLGILFGNSPEMEISTSTSYYDSYYSTVINAEIKVNQGSASTTSISYGFGTGVIIANRFDISIRYLASEPNYSFTAKGYYKAPPYYRDWTEIVSESGESKQPTSTIQLNFGIIIN